MQQFHSKHVPDTHFRENIILLVKKKSHCVAKLATTAAIHIQKSGLFTQNKI